MLDWNEKVARQSVSVTAEDWLKLVACRVLLCRVVVQKLWLLKMFATADNCAILTFASDRHCLNL